MNAGRTGIAQCPGCSVWLDWEVPTGDWYTGVTRRRFFDQGTRVAHVCPVERAVYRVIRDYTPVGSPLQPPRPFAVTPPLPAGAGTMRPLAEDL